MMDNTVCDLANKSCKACQEATTPMSADEAMTMLAQLDGWALDPNGKVIHKTFAFKGYYATMAFVNAIAYMAQYEGHHPDIMVSYNQCVVHYSTHNIDGLSESDFICAAKVENIFAHK